MYYPNRDALSETISLSSGTNIGCFFTMLQALCSSNALFHLTHPLNSNSAAGPSHTVLSRHWYLSHTGKPCPFSLPCFLDDFVCILAVLLLRPLPSELFRLC